MPRRGGVPLPTPAPSRRSAAVIVDAGKRGGGYKRQPVPASWAPGAASNLPRARAAAPLPTPAPSASAASASAAAAAAAAEEQSDGDDFDAPPPSELQQPALLSTARLQRKVSALQALAFAPEEVPVAQSALLIANRALNASRAEQLYDYSAMGPVEAPTPTRERKVPKQVRSKWLRQQALKPSLQTLRTPALQPPLAWVDQPKPTLMSHATLAADPLNPPMGYGAHLVAFEGADAASGAVPGAGLLDHWDFCGSGSGVY